MDSYKKSRRKSIIAWVIAFVLAIGAAIVSFTPFIFMVLNSFKEKFEMLTKGVFQLPDQLNWSNYTEVLTGGFANYFKNSVIVLAVSLILLLFISACASYPLARFILVFSVSNQYIFQTFSNHLILVKDFDNYLIILLFLDLIILKIAL